MVAGETGGCPGHGGGTEEVKQLTVTGPALAVIVGKDPATEQISKEEHGTNDDRC